MKKVVDYLVVKENDLEVLMYTVAKLLKIGYQPQGGISTGLKYIPKDSEIIDGRMRTDPAHYELIFMQAMVKYENQVEVRYEK